MSIPVLPTTDVKFVAGTIGLFGAAPGAAYLSEFKTFNANPEVTMTALAGLVQKDAAKLAAVVVANLGLTGAAATAGTAYLTGEFKANPTNHGKVIIDALLTLTTLTADATFGTAATAVTTMINKGAAYSAVSTNTSKDLTVLKAAIAAGAVNEGVIGVDSGKFTATNDTVTVSATTLNAGDTFVDPSTLDNDVLTLNLQGNVQNPLLGTRFVNIETMAINVAGLIGTEAVAGGALSAGANLNFASQTQTTGLKTITVSGDSRGSLGLLSVRDEVSRVDASAMSDDQNDADGIHLTFGANINATGTATARTILGSQGRDSIVSTGGADTISGNAGDDVIEGGAGNDSIDGGAGADSILAGTGNDIVIGGAGADTIRTNGGSDSVTAGDANDVVEVSLGHTGSAPATVLGGTGDDFITVNGTTGGVAIDGQDDNDTVFFWNATTVDATVLEGGFGGRDTLAMSNTLNAAIGQNLLNKSAGFEVYNFTNSVAMNGETSTDVAGFSNNTFSLAGKTSNLTAVANYAVNLTMGSGNDTVTGSAGADVIAGGAGADSITGGAGNDTFVFEATANGGDRVTDFVANVATDVLDFTAFLGSAAAVDAIAIDNIAGAGLDLTGENVGVLFNKAGALTSVQIVAAGVAAGQVLVADNQKAVVLTTTAAVSDAVAGSTFNVYYVQDTNAIAGATQYSVTLAGQVTLSDAFSMADRKSVV